MGALFSVPVAHAPAAEEFFGWAAALGITVAAACGRAAVSLWDCQLEFPLAILLGSEGAGLPAGLLARAGHQVRIPMTGTADSLNLAVAAGIVMYEAWRQAGWPE
jgi:TrmH family RNA methyltransferase